MSDFTNDLRYPKSGSLLFDTKDPVDVTVSKTGDTRSMTATYTDPETGEVLQTSEGGGGAGVQNYDLFEIDGQTITSNDCFAQNTQPSSTGGREAHASITGCYLINLTAGTTYAAELTYEGETLTGTGTATENSFTGSVNMTISLSDESKSIQFTGSTIGTQISFNGFSDQGEYAFVQAATVEAAVQTLATNIASLGLVITSES